MEFEFDLEFNSSGSGASFEEESEDNIGYKFIVPNTLKKTESIRSAKKEDTDRESSGKSTDEDGRYRDSDNSDTSSENPMGDKILANISADNNTTMNLSVAESENHLEYEDERKDITKRTINSTNLNNKKVSFAECAKLTDANSITKPSEYRNVIKLIPEILISKSPVSPKILASPQEHNEDHRRDSFFFSKIVSSDFAVEKNNLNEFVDLLIKDFKKDNVEKQIIKNFQLLNEKSIQDGKKFKILKEKLSDDLTNSENQFRSLQEENLKIKEVICNNESEIQNLRLTNSRLKTENIEIENKKSRIIYDLTQKVNNIYKMFNCDNNNCNNDKKLEEKLEEISTCLTSVITENKNLKQAKAEMEKATNENKNILENSNAERMNASFNGGRTDDNKCTEKDLNLIQQQKLLSQKNEAITENFKKISVQIQNLTDKINNLSRDESLAIKEILTFLNCKVEQKEVFINSIQNKNTELRIENYELGKNLEILKKTYEQNSSYSGLYYKQLMEIVESYLKNFIDERSFVTFEMKKKEKSQNRKGILFGDDESIDDDFLTSVNEFFQRCFKMVYNDSIKKQERVEYLEKNIVNLLEKEEKKTKKSTTARQR